MPQPWFRDGALHFALGVEDTFVPQARAGERAIDEYELTEHDQRWHSDLALATGAGAQMLRWGIPWYRIQPEVDRFEWSWLDRVIDRFAELELRPIIDLLHYGTPLWLENEFAHPDYPQRVADYAVAVADRYRDLVTDYTPVNEPMIHALFSGSYGYWPPYLTGDRGLVTLCRQLAHGFQLTQRGIAEALGDAAVFVHVDAGMRFDGDPERAEEIAHHREQVWLVEDLVTGRVGPDHPLADFLSRSGMPDDDLARFRQESVLPDVMGINYYPRHSTELLIAGQVHRGGFDDPRPVRDDGIAGLEELLREASARYGAPVAVTETCVTGSIADREHWLDASLASISSLRASGLDVVAYTWWPLFDMYEWTWRHTTAPRADHLLSMGLFALEETDAGLARVPTPLVERFRQHANDPIHRPHAQPTEGPA